MSASNRIERFCGFVAHAGVIILKMTFPDFNAILVSNEKNFSAAPTDMFPIVVNVPPSFALTFNAMFSVVPTVALFTNMQI